MMPSLYIHEKMDADRGPYARSPHPAQWCVDRGLLFNDQGQAIQRPLLAGKKEKALWANIPKPMRGTYYRLDGRKAKKMMIEQLGRPMPSSKKLAEELSEYEQILFAVFSAFGHGSQAELGRANKVLDNLGRSFKLYGVGYDSKKPVALEKQGKHTLGQDETCKAFLKNHLSNPSKAVLEYFKRHYYIYTLLSSMGKTAKARSTLGTCDYLWLKPCDRQLHYVLNQVGRPTAWIEVAGVRSHLLAEERARRALQEPQVEEALAGLALELEREGYLAPILSRGRQAIVQEEERKIDEEMRDRAEELRKKQAAEKAAATRGV